MKPHFGRYGIDLLNWYYFDGIDYGFGSTWRLAYDHYLKNRGY